MIIELIKERLLKTLLSSPRAFSGDPIIKKTSFPVFSNRDFAFLEFSAEV